MKTNPNTDIPPLHNFAAGLLGDFLEDHGLSQRGLAAAIHVPAQRINDVLAGRRLITPDMALRLGRYFGNRPEYWLALQDEWLLRKAKLENAQEISSIHPLATA
jgi:addiction module HigA family antidote